MALPKYITAHPAPIQLRQRVRVVSWLAFPDGPPVTNMSAVGRGCFIKTELFDNSDDAISMAHELQEEGAVFVSCQVESGESII